MRQGGDDQSEVFAFMADPATHGGAPVRRIDTHSGVVFLAGNRAFKIKRAVRYSYLDFSTLAQRRAACQAELEINRVFAPGLYLRVVPITREKNGALRLGGDGEIVEWAVEMRRFDETKTLDRLADERGIDLALADRLARVVAATHSRVPVFEGAPWIAALSRYVEQNDAAFRTQADLFDPARTEQLGRDSRRALDQLRPLLAARSAEGMVRRGHGDLHLANVALVDGDPMLFDAVEFSPLIAAGDVMYDLAFLLMDLVERGLSAAANVVLNRYLAETRRMSDLDAVAALPFFMSLRAAIRANVTASRAAVAPARDRAEARSSAAKYFALACRLIRPAPPMLVGVGGLSGAGKSQLAAALAPELAPPPGAIVLRSDVERKALDGRREDERLPKEAYTAEKSARVYAALVEKASRIVSAGHSAIVDAVFARPEERDALRRAARARGVAFHGLFLVADLATRLTRVGARRGDASDADSAIVRAQEQYVLGHNDWESIDASGAPQCTLARARKAVA
ncbi:MAG TPA: AAA family ATPase [Xanthobacteraceae bacterium]|jgi:aminoglycoside phosphotransferase family enzyme/predicted kinase|nr:AAA family ATPase [Xanthobacteraceae bacterium]